MRKNIWNLESIPEWSRTVLFLIVPYMSGEVKKNSLSCVTRLKPSALKIPPSVLGLREKKNRRDVFSSPNTLHRGLPADFFPRGNSDLSWSIIEEEIVKWVVKKVKTRGLPAYFTLILGLLPPGGFEHLFSLMFVSCPYSLRHPGSNEWRRGFLILANQSPSPFSFMTYFFDSYFYFLCHRTLSCQSL